MFIALISVAIAMLMFGYARYREFMKLRYVTLLCVAAIAVVFAGFILATTIPNDNYEEKKLTKEIELIPVNTSSDSTDVFVIVTKDTKYEYKYNAEDGGKEGEIESDLIKLEQGSVEKPVLQVYEEKSIKSPWVFTGKDRISYTFKVPAGSIAMQK